MQRKHFISAVLVLLLCLSLSVAVEAASIREQLVASEYVERVYPMSPTNTLILADVDIFGYPSQGFCGLINKLMKETNTSLAIRMAMKDELTGRVTENWAKLEISPDGTFVNPITGEKKKWRNAWYKPSDPGSPGISYVGALGIHGPEKRPYKWLTILHKPEPFIYKAWKNRKFDFSKLPADGELFNSVEEVKDRQLLDPQYQPNDLYAYLYGLCDARGGKLRKVLGNAGPNGIFNLFEVAGNSELAGGITESARNSGLPPWFLACEGPEKFVVKGDRERAGVVQVPYLRVKFLKNRDISEIAYAPLALHPPVLAEEAVAAATAQAGGTVTQIANAATYSGVVNARTPAGCSLVRVTARFGPTMRFVGYKVCNGMVTKSHESFF